MSVKRNTRVIQELKVEVDLGALSAAKHLEKVRVQRKLDGLTMLVNRRDFHKGGKYSPDAYLEIDLIDPDEGIDLPPATDVREETSLFTPDELAVMPIRKLRELPEFTRITDVKRRKLRVKQDYLDAIAEVRGADEEPDEQRIAL